MAAKPSHRLPNPTPAQCRRARADLRKIVQRIKTARTKAGALLAASDLERHAAIAQVIAFEIAPLVAAGLVDRAHVDPALNRALGRRGNATLENRVLSLALVRVGRRARGAA